MNDKFFLWELRRRTYYILVSRMRSLFLLEYLMTRGSVNKVRSERNKEQEIRRNGQMKEEKRRIFNLVKEGHLTVEEAMVLLDNLEKKEQGEDQTTSSFEEVKKEDTFNQNFKSIKDKVFGFVDSAVKKVKEVDLDFNFGNSAEVTHKVAVPAATITELEVDVANGSITVLPWEKDEIEMNFNAKIYRVEDEAQGLKKFLHELNYKVTDRTLRLVIEPKTMKVETVIYVPVIKYNSLKLRSFNGDIVTEKLDVTNCRVKTANGNINVKEFDSTSIELETANGNINALDVKVKDMEAESLNGKLNLVGDFEEVEAQSFNGDVTVKLAGNRAKELYLNCVTGAINIDMLENYSLKGKCKTNLGNLVINLDNLEIIEEKRDIVQKYIRFNTIVAGAPELKVVADTKTGTVSINKVKTTTSEDFLK